MTPAGVKSRLRRASSPCAGEPFRRITDICWKTKNIFGRAVFSAICQKRTAPKPPLRKGRCPEGAKGSLHRTGVLLEYSWLFQSWSSGRATNRSIFVSMAERPLCDSLRAALRAVARVHDACGRQVTASPCQLPLRTSPAGGVHSATSRSEALSAEEGSLFLQPTLFVHSPRQAKPLSSPTRYCVFSAQPINLPSFFLKNAGNTVDTRNLVGL